MEDQKERALILYEQYRSVTKVIQLLGYPTRQTLYKWIEETSLPAKEEKFKEQQGNAPKHSRYPSAEFKLEAIHRCFELGENIQSVSEEIGYSRTSIYSWRRKYLRGGIASLMNSTDSFHSQLPEESISASLEIERLRAQIRDMKLEIESLKKALAISKEEQK